MGLALVVLLFGPIVVIGWYVLMTIGACIVGWLSDDEGGRRQPHD